MSDHQLNSRVVGRSENLGVSPVSSIEREENASRAQLPHAVGPLPYRDLRPPPPALETCHITFLERLEPGLAAAAQKPETAIRREGPCNRSSQITDLLRKKPDSGDILGVNSAWKQDKDGLRKSVCHRVEHCFGIATNTENEVDSGPSLVGKQISFVGRLIDVNVGHVSAELRRNTAQAPLGGPVPSF
jgi:hypothetical protein